MKDNFSTQAKAYAQFRPTYPAELYDFLYAHIPNKKMAWDCATGNGQVALALAQVFEQVYATDMSAKQLENAGRSANITYLVEPAEHTSFGDQSFDLITVAQAIHWFNFDTFFAEVRRILKPDGFFAAIGYGLMQINHGVDKVIFELYETILGKYWDPERRHIEQNYETIPFPFIPIEAPNLFITTKWDFNQLIGYLETWSALQHYLKANGNNPIMLVIDKLKNAWGTDEIKDIRFPLIIKSGQLNG